MRQGMYLIALTAAGAFALGATAARATDIGVAPTKLIIVDKLAAAGKAKAVFVAKDGAVDKGMGTDVGDISAQFDVKYAGASGNASGKFLLPAGASDGTSGWLVNKSAVAKYVNKDAPSGPTGSKVSVIKPGNLVKIVGKNLGDGPIDLIANGAPTGNVYASYEVTNGGDTNRFCSMFHDCAFKEIAGGSGRKLVCKTGDADPDCLATTTPEICGNDIVEGSEECDDGNVDPTDGCTKECTICGNNVVTAPEGCDDGNLINGDGCDSNCQPTGCGNGLVVPPETCDDGNTDDMDNCPSDCIIDACTPEALTDVPVRVDFAGSENVAGITVFVDYPEGKVSIPGSGGGVPSGIITDLPGFAFGQTNDLDHALIQAVVDSSAFPSGQLFRIHFESCTGAPAPVDGDFSCTVTAAGDENLDPIPGVTCSVHVE